MALLKQSIDGKILTITKVDPNQSDKPTISFDTTASPKGKSFQGKIWDDAVVIAEVDPKLSDWFTAQLGMKCKLVSFHEEQARPVDLKYHVNRENVSLADAYPFLIIGQSSLDDVNARLENRIPMNRFRPNFVFTGGTPFEEDTWRNFSIGANRFVAVKPCARCVLTTVNQDTAEKGVEPLYTLSKYRKKEAKVLFGQNLVAIDHTIVNVGDRISVQELRK
jgi:uncharacterized protein YcbX